MHSRPSKQVQRASHNSQRTFNNAETITGDTAIFALDLSLNGQSADLCHHYANASTCQRSQLAFLHSPREGSGQPPSDFVETTRSRPSKARVTVLRPGDG